MKKILTPLLIFATILLMTSPANLANTVNAETVRSGEPNAEAIKENIEQSGDWEKVKETDESTTYEISNEEIAKSFRTNGYEKEADMLEEKSDSGPTLFSKGVNSFTVNSDGSYTIKLTETVAQVIAVGGAGVATTLVGLIPGLGWSIAAGAAGPMIGVLAGQTINDGVSFTVKKVGSTWLVLNWGWQ